MLILVLTAVQIFFDINDPVSEWADLTVLDLHNKDYACVYATTIYSDAVELSNTHSVICLRRGTPNSGYSDLPPDFHYMSLTGSSWYHKPGGSQPLRYHHLPYEDNWTNEAIADGNLGIITHTYTGTIHYFAYRESHSLTSVYNNFHYHLGDYHYFEYATTCRYCGEVTEVTLTRMECSGPPCSVPDLASISPEDLST